MKKENSTLLKKLQQYSALAAPMLATAGFANGQVVFHDIDPDRILISSSPPDTMHLDLNSDGIVDFKFFALTNGANKDLGVMPFLYLSTSNAVAGNVISYSTGQGVSGPLLFPSALAAGAPIDQNLPWYNENQLLFVTGGTAAASVLFYPAMNSLFGGGYYGNWLDGLDHYVPLKAVSSAGTVTNYGWARCNAAADATTLTVESWAVQMTPDSSIQAGEGEPTGINSPNASNEFSILAYEGVASVFINDGKLEGTSVKITNMIGETLVNQPVNNRLTRIDLNHFAKGIYLVSVSRGSENFSRKVSFR